MKTFTIDNTEYTVRTCTAIALNAGDTERQDALLVTSHMNGEKSEYVVFGYEMPKTEEDFALMSEDSTAWDSDYETLATVEI